MFVANIALVWAVSYSSIVIVLGVVQVRVYELLVREVDTEMKVSKILERLQRIGEIALNGILKQLARHSVSSLTANAFSSRKIPGIGE